VSDQIFHQVLIRRIVFVVINGEQTPTVVYERVNDTVNKLHGLKAGVFGRSGEVLNLRFLAVRIY
jgi:hypothetical protein